VNDSKGIDAGPVTAIEASGIAHASAGKIGIWVFIATDTMGFGALLLAYAVLRVRSEAWPDPAVRFDRSWAAGMTFILLASAAIMNAAVVAAREGRARSARILIMLAAAAGLGFLGGQTAELRSLAVVRHVGLTHDHAGSLFYVLAGYHGLHVLVGVVVLVIAGIAGVETRADHRHSESGAGHVAMQPQRASFLLQGASLYWQFVDLVWIVIFTAVYLLPPVARG
jgi:cytochrome c oxidase subunit III